MSRIKQALELLAQEASTLAPEARQLIEKLSNEARLLIQPVSEPLSGLEELLATLRANATDVAQQTRQSLADAKDEAAEVIASLTELFESQGLEVRVQAFEMKEGETEEEFHARVKNEIEAFEASAFGDEEKLDLAKMSRAELEAYVHEMDAMLGEADETLSLASAAHDAQEEKIAVLSKAVADALSAISDLDIKSARELLQKVVK